MLISLNSDRTKRTRVDSTSKSFAATNDSLHIDQLSDLRQVFTDPGAPSLQQLAFQDIWQVLRGRANAEFDQQILVEVFAQAGKRLDQTIEPEEFVQAYIHTEKVLWADIQQLSQQVFETQEKLSQTRSQLLSAQVSEKLNDNGIMDGSTLSVTVQEAQDLMPSDEEGSADPYAVLLCESQRIETTYHINTLNPAWRETFTFQIKTGKDDMKVVVMDHDSQGTDNFVGQANVPLGALRDQMEHEEWCELVGKKGEKWQGRIKLKLQWIWSKKLYLAAVMQQWEAYIEEDLKTIEELKQRLRKMREPFDTSGTRTVDKLFSSMHVRTSDDVLSQRIDRVTATAFGGRVDWGRFSLSMTLAFICVSVVAMFSRTDFVNLTIGIAGFYLFAVKANSHVTYRLLAIFVLTTQLFDVVWLLLYGIVSNRQNHTLGLESEAQMRNVHKVGVLATVVGVILKFMLVGVYYRQGVEISRSFP